MILNTTKTLNKKLIKAINNVALDISMTISSQAPRSVSTDIVVNNLEKVQRLGSEIGINNLPKSAQQLKHKVIKVCENCSKIELTSKYNFLASYNKVNKVLCRKCAQNTNAESQRRSNNQKRLHTNPEYKQNAVKKLIEESRSENNSIRIKKAHENGKYANKDWSFTQTLDWRIKRHCINKNIQISEFEGFCKKARYPMEFNKSLKKSIKERDNYSCILCNSVDKRLDIHHVDFDKNNNNPTNLATLCASCHAKITMKGKDCKANKKVEDIVRTYKKL